MIRTLDMDLGKTLGSIGKIMFAVGFTAAIINLTGLFGEFSGGRIIELSAIGRLCRFCFNWYRKKNEKKRYTK